MSTVARLTMPTLCSSTAIGDFASVSNDTQVIRCVAPTQVSKLEQGNLLFSMVERGSEFINATIETLGSDEEITKFKKAYDGPDHISAPHHHFEYKTIDRNRQDAALDADPFFKMTDSLFTGFSELDQLENADFAFIYSMATTVPVDGNGMPLVNVGPDLQDPALLVNCGRHVTGSGDYGRSKAKTKHETYPEDIAVARHLLDLIDRGAYCVAYVPSTTTRKGENLKYLKGTRYIAMEHAVINMLSQIIVGHYIDSHIGISHNNSMNGLTPQYGVLPYIIDRQLKSQTGNGISFLEEFLNKHTHDEKSLQENIDAINDAIIAIVSDFKNYEFNHNPLAKIISRLQVLAYYTPTKGVSKLLSYWVELHCFVHMLLGYDGHVNSVSIAPRTGTVISGTLDTLFGNNEIQTVMHLMALYHVYQMYKDHKDVDLYIAWVLNRIMMGDDFYSLANPLIVPMLLEHSSYLANKLFQHLKYEYTKFLCKRSPLGFNFDAGDFLKNCPTYAEQLGKIIFFKPTDQFFLRLLAYNSPDIQAVKLLASYSSMALQTGSNPFMYAMLKKLYDEAFVTITDAKLINRLSNSRVRAIEEVLGVMYSAPSPSADSTFKQEQKFVPDPMSTEQVNVLEFPSWERVVAACSDNAAILAMLHNNNTYYCTYNINHIAAATFVQEKTTK